MPDHCYYLAIFFTNHLYLYSYIYSLAMHLRYSSAPLVEALPLIAAALTAALAMYGWVYDLIQRASEADYRSCSIEQIYN